MCTVVCRSAPGELAPVQMLALRDEVASRAFDLPNAWWPGQPQVVGGRDQLRGGTWCAADVRSGVVAVVLNQPDRPKGEDGAPSRGALPLLAVTELDQWPQHIDVAAMAGFNLILATPDSLTWWFSDGNGLVRHVLDAGTYLFNPRGMAVPIPDERFSKGSAHFEDESGNLSSAFGGVTDAVWADWLPVIEEREPSEDPLAMLVRVPRDGDIFETVFGQFIAIRPGALRLDYAIRPHNSQPWTLAQWRLAADSTATHAAAS